MSVLQLHESSSSSAVRKPLAEGMPSWVSYADFLIDTFFETLVKNIDEYVQVLNEELYTELNADPEWSPFSKDVHITFEKGELIANITSEDAVNLEYGSPSVSVNSKVRPFIVNAIERLKEHVTEELKEVYL